MMSYKVERFVINVIEERIKSRIVSSILLVLSILHEYILKLKKALPQKEKYYSSMPLICVGNITAGGTGKTPFIDLCLQSLDTKVHAGLISRGYRSVLEKQNRGVFLQSEPEYLDPALCGDEPYMLAKRYPSLECLIDKNRLRAVKEMEKKPLDLVFFDDGLQYPYLHFSQKVIMISSSDPFGRGYFLPRGYLRDEPSSIKDADLLVINGTAEKNRYEEIKNQLRRYSKAPVMGTKMKLTGDKGSKVGAFCAIGNPGSFFADLKDQLNVDIVHRLELADHQKPTDMQLKEFALESAKRGATTLVCTEKDFVKLSPKLSLEIPITFAKAKLEIVFEKENYDHFLQTCLSKREKADETVD